MVAALIWGFSEATLFFIVPDVLISYLAVRSFKRAMHGILFGIIGALIGGSLMYTMGMYDRDAMLVVIDKVPAISGTMIDEVEMDLQDKDVYAIFLGPTKGTPYKIYATQAYEAGIPFLTFLLVSIPARGVRFLLTALLSHFILNRCFGFISHKYRYGVLTLFWSVFYCFYFSVM